MGGSRRTGNKQMGNTGEKDFQAQARSAWRWSQQESLLLPKAVLMSNTALALSLTQTSWVWSTMYSQGQLQTPQVWCHSKHHHHSFPHLELPFLLLYRCNFFCSETQWKAVTFSPITFLPMEKEAFLHGLWYLHREHRKEKSDGWTAWFLISRSYSNFLMTVGKVFSVTCQIPTTSMERHGHTSST